MAAWGWLGWLTPPFYFFPSGAVEEPSLGPRQGSGDDGERASARGPPCSPAAYRSPPRSRRCSGPFAARGGGVAALAGRACPRCRPPRARSSPPRTGVAAARRREPTQHVLARKHEPRIPVPETDGHRDGRRPQGDPIHSDNVGVEMRQIEQIRADRKGRNAPPAAPRRRWRPSGRSRRAGDRLASAERLLDAPFPTATRPPTRPPGRAR